MCCRYVLRLLGRSSVPATYHVATWRCTYGHVPCHVAPVVRAHPCAVHRAAPGLPLSHRVTPLRHSVAGALRCRAAVSPCAWPVPCAAAAASLHTALSRASSHRRRAVRRSSSRSARPPASPAAPPSPAVRWPSRPVRPSPRSVSSHVAAALATATLLSTHPFDPLLPPPHRYTASSRLYELTVVWPTSSSAAKPMASPSGNHATATLRSVLFLPMPWYSSR